MNSSLTVRSWRHAHQWGAQDEGWVSTRGCGTALASALVEGRQSLSTHLAVTQAKTQNQNKSAEDLEIGSKNKFNSRKSRRLPAFQSLTNAVPDRTLQGPEAEHSSQI